MTPTSGIRLALREREIVWPRRPLIMGIVNINDDSFCNEGTLDVVAAMGQALMMATQGADIIDAGAESARTNRKAISEEEEIERMEPFIAQWKAAASRLAKTSPPIPGQLWPPLLSLNTWRPGVVRELLPLGGDLLNDMGALPDDQNARHCARHGAALLIMHSLGQPKQPHTHVAWPDIMSELDRFFSEKTALAREAGMDPQGLILDPGLDFAKQKHANLIILNNLARLSKFQCPMLLPVSRKTVIGDVLDQPDPLQRDAGTIGVTASIMAQNPGLPLIFRVHNVPAVVDAVRVLHALDQAEKRSIDPSGGSRP